MKFFKSFIFSLIVALFGLSSTLMPMDKQNQKTNTDITSAASAANAAQPHQTELTLKQLQVLAYPFDKQANATIKAVRAKYESEAAAIAAVNKALEKRIERRRIDDRDSNGKTALMYAAMNGLSYLIPVLIAHGAAVDATDNAGQTALGVAAFYNHPSCAKALLDLKADINHQCKDAGKTILMDAVITSAKEIVALLLERGVNSSVKTPAGYNALSFAHRALSQDTQNDKKREIMYMLLKYKGGSIATASQTPPPLKQQEKKKKREDRSVTPLVLTAAASTSSHSSPIPAASPSSSPSITHPESSPDVDLMTMQSTTAAATAFSSGEFTFTPIEAPAESESPMPSAEGNSGSARFQSPLPFESNAGGFTVRLEPIANAGDHIPALVLATAATNNSIAYETPVPEVSALEPSPLLASLSRLQAQSPADQKAIAEKAAKAKKRKDKKKKAAKLSKPVLKAQPKGKASPTPTSLKVLLATEPKVQAETSTPASTTATAAAVESPAKPVALTPAFNSEKKEAAQAIEIQEPETQNNGSLGMYYDSQEKYEEALASHNRKKITLRLQRDKAILTKFNECGYIGWERKGIKKRIAALKARLACLPKPQATE